MSNLLKEHNSGTQSIEQVEINTLMLVDILKSESRIIDGHTDPQSYYECWNFLREDIKEAFDTIHELMNELQKKNSVPEHIQEALNSGDGAYRP